LVVQAPTCDIAKHEDDAAAHLLIVLEYLLKQNAEQLKTTDKQEVGDAFPIFVVT